MTTPGTPPLVYVTGCLCAAGLYCGGHDRLPDPAPVVAQHTYTQGCDGFHPPGPCPAFAVPFKFGPAWAPQGCCGKPRGCTNPDCPRRAQPDQ